MSGILEDIDGAKGDNSAHDRSEETGERQGASVQPAQCAPRPQLAPREEPRTPEGRNCCKVQKSGGVAKEKGLVDDERVRRRYTKEPYRQDKRPSGVQAEAFLEERSLFLVSCGLRPLDNGHPGRRGGDHAASIVCSLFTGFAGPAVQYPRHFPHHDP